MKRENRFKDVCCNSLISMTPVKQIPKYVTYYFMVSTMNCSYLPSIGSVFCVIGFFACFIITKSLRHIPDWLVTPPISFLGFDNPEHYVYAFCFTTGALCYQIVFCYIQRYSFLSCGMYIFFLLFSYNSQCDGFSGKWLRAATIIAMCSPIFLIIQAIIPLQKDLLDVNSFFNYELSLSYRKTQKSPWQVQFIKELLLFSSY